MVSNYQAFKARHGHYPLKKVNGKVYGMKAMKKPKKMKMGMKKMVRMMMKKKPTGKTCISKPVRVKGAARKKVFEGNGKKSPGALTKVTKKGRVDRTTLKKEDLTMNTAMKVVSKKVSNFHKSSLQGKKIVLWGQCLSKARMQLGIKGFKTCKKGTALYKATQALYLPAVANLQ